MPKTLIPVREADVQRAIEWRPVPGYESRYEISSDGQIRFLFSWAKAKAGSIKRFQKLPSGYLQVQLSDDDNVQKTYLVHRLVASAFIPNAEGKPEVNHLNCVRNDNRAENLEWVTDKENTNHGALYGRVGTDGRRKWAVLDEAQVAEIKRELKSYRRGMLTKLGTKYGVLKSTISEIRSGRSWRHVEAAK